MKPLLDSLKSLGPARLGAMGAVAIGMLAMLVLLASGGSHPAMALLYGDLDLREAGQMVDALDKAHIPNRLGGQGDRIEVPENQVLQARLLLAKSGLPSGGSVGYEIFDRGDNLTQTQFEQTINQTRALEGELVRSISLVHGVRTARVHLVLPHRAPFASDTQPAQASVLLSLSGAARLDPEAAQAIQTLVVAAVPELRAQNISIIDTRGNVLARAGVAQPGLDGAGSIADLRQQTELRLERTIEDLLAPSLGAGNVRAEASVTMDMQQRRETQESFNPDQQVLRSQKTSSDKSRNSEATQTTSVSNNLPNANAGQPANGSQADREEETNNYEIGKTVRTVIDDEPRIGRVTVSVLVNGADETTGGPNAAFKPRSQAELDQITSLVKTAIGFDPKRGDAVTVVSMRFSTGDAAIGADTATAPSRWLSFGSPDLMHVVQTALLGVFVLLALLLVVRPTMLRLAAPPGDQSPANLPPASALARLPGPEENAATPEDLPALGVEASNSVDTMINLARVDGQLRASSLRQISDLVRTHPMESLSIVRGWLGHEAG